jgi:putative Mg2+ transporter-C (MgtC) family protein
MNQEIIIILRLIIAAILGLIIGYERERKHKLKDPNTPTGEAGLRTHALVSIGSCLITAIGIFMFSADTARMAASIMTGIGFLGAGTIIATSGKIRGLTTAASIWVVAAIGLSVGTGKYLVSIAATIICLVVLELYKLEKADNTNNIKNTKLRK